MGRSRVEIRIRGHLEDDARRRLDDAYGHLAIAETVVAGDVADQTELQGALALLRDVGCEIVAVRRTATVPPPAG